jgi:hypothetical protein
MIGWLTGGHRLIHMRLSPPSMSTMKLHLELWIRCARRPGQSIPQPGARSTSFVSRMFATKHCISPGRQRQGGCSENCAPSPRPHSRTASGIATAEGMGLFVPTTIPKNTCGTLPCQGDTNHHLALGQDPGSNQKTLETMDAWGLNCRN